MRASPCVKNGIHCPARHLGCQAECQDYADYYAENRALEAEKRKNDVVKEYINSRDIKRKHREHVTGGRRK